MFKNYRKFIFFEKTTMIIVVFMDKLISIIKSETVKAYIIIIKEIFISEHGATIY